jgi:hypothetical protein
MMAPALIGALVLVAAAALACWRLRRQGPLLLLLQPLLALALWLALWPLPDSRPSATLVVATAHTTAAEWQRYREAGPGVALPEALALPGAQPVPDLATALRRLPQAGRLRVLGDGLTARDRAAVGSRGVDFDPASPRPALGDIQAPTRTVVGQPWHVSGAVAALPRARVELLDPAGRRVATTAVDAAGRFALVATPPATGRVDYVLQLRDAAGRERERLALALDSVEGRRPRVWLLSGGPDPEQKFLRRWADDAHLDARAGASLGAGVQLGDAVPLTAAALADADLLVLDPRAWRGAGAGTRAQLRRAVAEGLGLLLRLQDAPSAGDRAVLREFSFELVAADATPVHLAGARPPFPHEEPVTLLRAPLQATAADAVVLVADAGGAPLARWRALGRGRVAAWWVAESYRLVLAGQSGLHAQLWSRAVTTLARADAVAPPRLRDPPAWAQQRAVVCELAAGARVRDPAGRPTPLLPDARGCAAWWPAQAGWHRIESGGRVLDWPVLAETAWPGIRARADREATRALRTAAAASARDTASVPGSRWPGFIGWLLLAALTWWLERRRRADEPQVATG